MRLHLKRAGHAIVEVTKFWLTNGSRFPQQTARDAAHKAPHQANIYAPKSGAYSFPICGPPSFAHGGILRPMWEAHIGFQHRPHMGQAFDRTFFAHVGVTWALCGKTIQATHITPMQFPSFLCWYHMGFLYQTFISLIGHFLYTWGLHGNRTQIKEFILQPAYIPPGITGCGILSKRYKYLVKMPKVIKLDNYTVLIRKSVKFDMPQLI